MENQENKTKVLMMIQSYILGSLMVNNGDNEYLLSILKEEMVKPGYLSALQQKIKDFLDKLMIEYQQTLLNMGSGKVRGIIPTFRLETMEKQKRMVEERARLNER